jgi:hypothetical protein
MLQTIWQGVRAAFRFIYSLIRIWLWQMFAAVLLVILFIIIVIRPFSAPPEVTEEDVASAWNRSIARLGILPVFPPSEDIYVGDLLAVVADSEETPLLGKALRIAHLDLRKEVQEADKGVPVFSSTAELIGTNKIRYQDNKEIINPSSDERISLKLAAFPGITITHAVRSVGSFDWSLWRSVAGRRFQEVEQIRIPNAESYGAPAATALIRLDDWCADKQTRIYCSDQFVRRVLAYAVSDRVLATRKEGYEERYIARLQLRLVTRVYLTREIEHRRFLADANGALIELSVGPSQSPSKTSNGANDGENDSASERDRATIEAMRQETAEAVSGRLPSAKGSTFRADQRDLAIHETFQRPIAIGYRAVTVELPPARPSKELSR